MIIAEAAVGAVFGELLKTVLEMKDKAVMFKPTLVNLQSTLIAIAPVIKEIEQHNNDLGRPKEELESLIRQMEEGTKLVCKCSHIHRLNYVARVRYQEQLEAFVDSLVRFFIIDMQAQTARDQKESLLKVRRILSVVNKFPVDTVGASNPEPGKQIESEINNSTEAQSAHKDSVNVNSSVEAANRTITQLAHHGVHFVPLGYTFGSDMFVMDEVKGGSAYGAGTFA
ncbi:NAD(P)H dehydrogenase (quinone) FQR1 [Spatholobus suberectus]|nr:NAD(P)H dehydrogenase (quinone) FQR1 [Spatholobus suberectus]